jgi:transcriptional regulator with XRE-family HTH domain
MENFIGEARRNYETKNGRFTQKDAAKCFGVSLSTYKKWEQGQGMMNGEQLREIAMKYDTTVDYLLGVSSANYAVVDLPDDDELTDDEREYRHVSA